MTAKGMVQMSSTISIFLLFLITLLSSATYVAIHVFDVSELTCQICVSTSDWLGLGGISVLIFSSLLAARMSFDYFEWNPIGV